MLRNFIFKLLGLERYELAQREASAKYFLGELKASVEKEFSFLSLSYGFTVVHEGYVGRGACFLVLENDVMRLRVVSGGGLGGYDWSVGDKDAEPIFERGSGWLDLLAFVKEKLGTNESFPETGLPSWQGTPIGMLRDTYARVLTARIQEIMRLFLSHGRIAGMPRHSAGPQA